MGRPPLDVEKELDEVVGAYRPGSGRPWPHRAGRILAKGLLGASLALAAVISIVYVLHTRLRDAQTAPAPSRPVPVRIVPAG